MDSIRILCFGDSLTWGWTKFGEGAHPYANALVSALEKRMPATTISADVQGAPGDQVLLGAAQFIVSADPSTDEDAETPYTWAIILGGTNDLVMETRGSDIWESLKEVYKIPLQAGTKVLALTVPECGDCSASVDAQHDRLNTLIQSHKAIKIETFDLCSAIPYRSMPEDRKKVIWSDSIHFTAAGYDLLGSLLAERILELTSNTSRP